MKFHDEFRSWDDLPSLTAIALCDKEPVLDMQGLIRGYQRLKEALREFASQVFTDFSDITEDEWNELSNDKYQILVSVDEYAKVEEIRQQKGLPEAEILKQIQDSWKEWLPFSRTDLTIIATEKEYWEHHMGPELKRYWGQKIGEFEKEKVDLMKEIENLERYCQDNKIDFIRRPKDRIVEGYGKAGHYAMAASHAYKGIHLLSDTELTDVNIGEIIDVLPTIDNYILALGRKKNDELYHVAVLHEGLIRAMGLVNPDHDFFPIEEERFLWSKSYKKLPHLPEYVHPFHDLIVGIAYEVQRAKKRDKEFRKKEYALKEFLLS